MENTYNLDKRLKNISKKCSEINLSGNILKESLHQFTNSKDAENNPFHFDFENKL